MYSKEPREKAQAVMIWLHGLGADPQDMVSLSQDLNLRCPVRHIYLAAPIRSVTLNQGMLMPAWYDIVGMSLTAREDYQGLKQSQEQVHQTIVAQMGQGIPSSKIYLLGFSQGAAVALYTALECEYPLGGVLALSGYLPCQSYLKVQQASDLAIYLAMGCFDNVVLPAWSQQALNKIQALGFKNVQSYEYPMQHTVCAQEVRDIAVWLHAHIGNGHDDLEVL